MTYNNSSRLRPDKVQDGKPDIMTVCPKCYQPVRQARDRIDRWECPNHHRIRKCLPKSVCDENRAISKLTRAPKKNEQNIEGD